MYHTLFVLGAGPQRCIPTLFVLSMNRVSVNRGVSESWQTVERNRTEEINSEDMVEDFVKIKYF
jgi:hypothetical protein